jgi:HAD superfamily hydrolase (TIGR01509 family)
MTVKAFFFDLDGTLVDTHEANYLAYRHAVESVKGIVLDTELKTRIKAGESSNHFLPSLLPDLTTEEIALINNQKGEVYPDHLDASLLNEYLSVFLQQMSEHYATVLVTTAKRKNALAVLRQHNIEHYFSDMIFGDDVQHMKPHPEAYNIALKKTGLKSSEVIAFEDSSKGIEAAEAAGITTVHIRNFL